jgi:uncharacterized protein (TIGR02594 family)
MIAPIHHDAAGMPWLVVARKHIGLHEIPGPPAHPKIVEWLKSLRAWWTDDSENPWCGTYDAACLREAGLGYPKAWYRARAYLDYGARLPIPTYGSIVIYERGSGGGHVGFVVGRDDHGRIMTLGGNQRDSVNITPFDPKRVLGYRWPVNTDGTPVPVILKSMPLVHHRADSSSQEA